MADAIAKGKRVIVKPEYRLAVQSACFRNHPDHQFVGHCGEPIRDTTMFARPGKVEDRALYTALVCWPEQPKGVWIDLTYLTTQTRILA